jgi:hypothetical protein
MPENQSNTTQWHYPNMETQALRQNTMQVSTKLMKYILFLPQPHVWFIAVL